ncbi:MAG: hypothetical protein ACFFDN_08100 [Candidatus Hodarchaeota archaeon]
MGSITFVLQYGKIISDFYIFSQEFINFIWLLTVPILNIIAIALTKILEYKKSKIKNMNGNSILDEIEDLINKDSGISRLIKIEFYFLILSINMVIFYAGLSFWFKSPFPTLSLNIICSTFFIIAGFFCFVPE